MKLGNTITNMIKKITPTKFESLAANYQTLAELPEESNMKVLGVVTDKGYLYINSNMNLNMDQYDFANHKGLLVEIEDHIFIRSTIILKDGSPKAFSDIIDNRVFPVKELFDKDISNIKFGEVSYE